MQHLNSVFVGYKTGLLATKGGSIENLTFLIPNSIPQLKG